MSNGAPEHNDGAPMFLAALKDQRRRHLEARDVALIVAHPDDETISCGAQLGRLVGITLIVASDGAPRNLIDAHAHGFGAAEDYALARLDELRQAMALANMPERALVRLGVPDQETAFQLIALVYRVIDVLVARNIRTAITHSYEGGHPDHDATAFAVHCAATLLASRAPIDIIEVPLYHQGSTGLVRQEFAAGSDQPELIVRLSPAERAIKAQMVAVFSTQCEVIAPFSLEVERFRQAPSYDFGLLPNAGRIHYDAHNWGLTSSSWRELATAALIQLGLGGVPCH